VQKGLHIQLRPGKENSEASFKKEGKKGAALIKKGEGETIQISVKIRRERRRGPPYLYSKSERRGSHSTHGFPGEKSKEEGTFFPQGRKGNSPGAQCLK